MLVGIWVTRWVEALQLFHAQNFLQETRRLVGKHVGNYGLDRLIKNVGTSLGM